MNNCVFCNSATADSVRVGSFEISWNEKGDVTVAMVAPNGVTLPEASRFARFLRALAGSPEPLYPMREIVATAHGAFDRCPVCGAELGAAVGQASRRESA